MKKHKMKNLFKIGILIIGISFSILNCEKETIVNDNSLENHTTNNFEVEKVKLDQIINDNELKASLKIIEKQFDYNKNKTTLSKSSDNSISILTDDIIHVKTDSTEAYTFRIDKLSHPNSSFENFIIEKRNNNEYQFFIYRYSQSKQKHKGESVYTLSRELVENANINTVSPNNNASKYVYDEVTDCLYWSYTSSDCRCEIIEIDNCGGGSTGGGSGGSTSGTGSSPSGGGTSAGSSGGPTGSGSSTVGLLTPKLAWELIEYCLGESLANESLTWLQTQNEFDILPINTYLQDNSCSVEAKVFGKTAIEALMDDGEVDFDDNLILSKEFKDNAKLKCVYNKLAGDNNTLFKDTVGAFIDNPNVNLIFTIGDCGAAAGCTQDQYVEETGIITIKISNITETPIQIAQTIIHEAIHAELAKYVLEHDSTVDTNDKPRLFKLYKFYRESGVPEKHIDHPYMALNYINPIALALRQFDNNKYPIDYYKSLAWIGLKDFDVNAVLTDPLENTYSEYLSTIILNSTVCN